MGKTPAKWVGKFTEETTWEIVLVDAVSVDMTYQELIARESLVRLSKIMDNIVAFTI